MRKKILRFNSNQETNIQYRLRGAFYKFPDFFVLALKIVIDS